MAIRYTGPEQRPADTCDSPPASRRAGPHPAKGPLIFLYLSEGMVSLWRLDTPAQAPALSGGTFTLRLADANNLKGTFDARFEDGSRLECTYDIRGQNYVPGDDPTYNGPP